MMEATLALQKGGVEVDVVAPEDTMGKLSGFISYGSRLRRMMAQRLVRSGRLLRKMAQRLLRSRSSGSGWRHG